MAASEVRFETPWGPAVVWVSAGRAEGAGKTLFISDNLFMLYGGIRTAYLTFDEPVPRDEAFDWCDTFLRTRMQH